MNRTAPTILLLAFALMLPQTGLAQECEPSTSTTDETQTVITAETPAGTFYVATDHCQPECIFSVWVFQESNGIDGLQRNDEVRDDTCGGQIEADVFPLF